MSNRPVLPRAVIVSGDLHNVGDLALMMQTATGLRERLGIGRLAVRQWSALPAEVLAQLDAAGVAWLDGRKPLRVARAAKGALVVVGGGQMARDNASLASLGSVAGMMAWARLTGGRAAVLGCGVDALARPVHRRLWRAILRGASQVTVRDESARAAVARIGGGDVPVTADLMFMPSPLHVTLARRGGPPHVVVAPCVDASEGRAVEVERLAQLAVHGCEIAGVGRLCLIAHDARPAMDARIVSAVAGAVRRVRPDITVRTIAGYRLDVVLEAYAASCLTITNRLHPAIFSLVAERPVLIVDDGTAKLRRVAERFAIATISSNMERVPPEATARLRHEMEGTSPGRTAAMAAARSAATRNFDLLAKSLAAGTVPAPLDAPAIRRS